MNVLETTVYLHNHTTGGSDIFYVFFVCQLSLKTKNQLQLLVVKNTACYRGLLLAPASAEANAFQSIGPLGRSFL